MDRHSRKRINESIENTFEDMKLWIDKTNPDGRQFAYDGPFSDYVDSLYMNAVEKYNQKNGTNVSTQSSIQLGFGISEISDDKGGYAKTDFTSECELFLALAEDSDTQEQFESALYNYVACFVDSMEYEDDLEESVTVENKWGSEEGDWENGDWDDDPDGWGSTLWNDMKDTTQDWK